MYAIGRNLRACAIALLWSGMFAASAHAHGGIAGPDDLGPPVITSAVLGLAGYWLMMLWPSRDRTQVNRKRKAARNAIR
ncbi:MAG TPA: hypothetical protein VKT27_15900 [Candidatus Binataceae bacterium]|nr:hypothetical protein [Candidatus Binataceae bacterium]